MIPNKETMQKALIQRHGKELQEKISHASVAVCGLGGLGSNVAIALARAGVGRLHLIDFDTVDITNLNRQQYLVNQIGQYKVDAMRENIKDIAPYTEVVCDCLKITEENLTHLFQQDTIICEAFDVPEAKATLVNGVLDFYPDKKIVSASGMAGLGSSNTIRTRKITGHFYLCGDEISDSNTGLGLISSRVLICAAHEANMILRLIAGETEA